MVERCWSCISGLVRGLSTEGFACISAEALWFDDDSHLFERMVIMNDTRGACRIVCSPLHSIIRIPTSFWHCNRSREFPERRGLKASIAETMTRRN